MWRITASTLLLIVGGCVAAADAPSPTDPHGVSTSTTASSTSTTIISGPGLAAFEGCLKQEGVEIDAIPVDGLGRPRMAIALAGIDFTDRSTLDALDKCGPLLSAGALDLTGDPALREMVQANLVEFAMCVRERGVIGFPDPVPDFSGVGSPFPVGRIPWSDPGMPNAVGACTLRFGA